MLAALAAASIHVPGALAQTVPWRVVAAESGGVVVAGLPASGRFIYDVSVGDVGAGLVGLRVSSPDSSAGYWARQQGTFKRYTQLGVTGVQGPGRSGAEATHVFNSVSSGGSGAGADGQRAFLARAGAPGAPETATWGLWRWNTAHNVEVARVLTDGALGPGLGAGWVFPNASDFTSGRMMNGGRVLLDADVTSPTGASSHLIAKHVPGQGNQPCIRAGSTDPSLAPGLSAGDSFTTSWSFSNLALTPEGRVYGRFSASGSRSGIWEICDGAPRAIAANNEAGARGPDIGVATATYTGDIYAPYPGNDGAIAFFASFRPTSGDSSRLGLFRNDGAGNRPLAINDASGDYGPHWEGSTWRVFDTDSLSVAGEYAAFGGGVTTGDGGNPAGFWRVRAGVAPELVALIGLVGSYGPEANRTWRSFGASAVLANGDIVIEAQTDPGDEHALWLLQAGHAPRRILELGQSVAVPTASGNVQAALTSFDVPNGGALYDRGGDGWIGADGTILIGAGVNGYSDTSWLIAQPSNPIDRIFRNGFDG
jgi:hypothetical protein